MQGTISLSFDTFRVPLGVPKNEFVKRVELSGKLQLREITLSVNTPLLQTVVKVLADMYGKKLSDVVRVVENADVGFRVRDGRIHHEDMRFGFPDISPDLLIHSRGSVGYDKTLDLQLDIPALLLNKGKPQVKKTAPVRLIEDVAARKEVVATIPYNAIVLGFHCQGVINGRGTLSVEMTTAQGEATFVVNGRGTGHADVRGVRGPIVALGEAWGPFTSRTVVRFDGRKSTVVQTTPWGEVHGELECVEGRHETCAGRAVGQLLLPVGRLLVPRAEAQAAPIGAYYLNTFVSNLAEEIVTRLNRTIPVEQSVHRIFPYTTDWVFQMSANPQYLQAAYGPRNAPVPVLPPNPGTIKDVRLELWLRSTTKEAEALTKLTKVPLAKEVVRKYLESILPELAALSENRSVDSVGQWLVISIGAPKAE